MNEKLVSPDLPILEASKSESLPEGQYYLKSKSKIQGPFHTSKILRYFRENRLTAETQFSSDQKQWKSITYFPHYEIESPSEKKVSNSLPSSILNLKALDSCYLLNNKELQGPYPFTKVLRYLREKRLPKEIEFSQDQKKWVKLADLFLNEFYYLRSKGRSQGPFPVARIFRYQKEGRFNTRTEFSQEELDWLPIEKFPYFTPEEKSSQEATQKEMEVMQANISWDTVDAETQFGDISLFVPQASAPSFPKLNLFQLKTCFLRQEESIQGPYTFATVLRYLHEKRLPQNSEFSQDQKNWVPLKEFLSHEEYYIRSNGEKQGPYPVSRILQYHQEGRLSQQDAFSQEGTNWVPFRQFPYLHTEQKNK
ncbi:MAG: hypothetical protein AABZ60_05835 [Planctomycetota bacterium]